MKKKLLSLALALILLFALSAPAMADTSVTTSGGTGSTDLSYTVAQAFTVTIPAEVTFTADKTGTMAVGVAAGALIPNDKSIIVTLTTCDFTLTNDDDELTYTIKDDAVPAKDVTLNTAVLTHAAGTTDATSEVLSLAFTGTAKYSGEYTDTLTFTVTVA